MNQLKNTQKSLLGSAVKRNLLIEQTLQEETENLEEDLRKRFWTKVFKKKPEECWEWTGSYRGGYGRIKINTIDISAHRLSWILHFGNFDEKMFCCHKCDNQKCVNPYHLFLGTHQDNMTDMVLKGRQYHNHNHKLKDFCKRGHSLSGGNIRVYIREIGRQKTQRICRACRRLAYHENKNNQ